MWQDLRLLCLWFWLSVDPLFQHTGAESLPVTQCSALYRPCTADLKSLACFVYRVYIAIHCDCMFHAHFGLVVQYL